MLDDLSEEVAARALTRLSQTLGVPLDAFFEAPSSERGEHAVTEQAAELLHLFRQIDDAGTRSRCLDFLRAIVGRPAASTATQGGPSV